jgi:hypothetical protein
MYFVGDLGAARRCAYDEDAAIGELTGISILLCGDRRDRWRHPLGAENCVSMFATVCL